MSRDRGTFYATIMQDDPSPEPSSAIIAFGSRNDADRWWRETCKAMLSTRTRWSLRQESPDLYVGDADVIVNGIRNGDPEITQDLPLFISSKDPSSIPPDSHPQLVSGETYFIRSFSDPEAYWYIDDEDGTVRVSKTNSSSFRITLLNPYPQFDQGLMIGQDLVVVEDPNTEGRLALNPTSHVLTLNGPGRDFFSLESITYHSDFVQAGLEEPLKKSVERGRGDEWVLESDS